MSESSPKSSGKTHRPVRGKGRRYPVEISCVAWIDLLGYGEMLKQVAFDPTNPLAQNAVNRLRSFQMVVASFGSRDFPCMPINDGAAFFKDLSPRTNNVTYDFLESAIGAYQHVNRVEAEHQFPGARMIIAVGPRMRIAGVVQPDSEHKRSIFARVKEGTVSIDQAIHEAFSSSPIAGFVPQLQANFAFTKAYCADEAGSEAGLGGNRCYVDLNLFEEALPPWISFARTQCWSMPGMSAIFGELSNFSKQIVGHARIPGILDALEIAHRLNVRY